jgi:hypothetical protein
MRADASSRWGAERVEPAAGPLQILALLGVTASPDLGHRVWPTPPGGYPYRTMPEISEEPPDENEAFANLDEVADDRDALGAESGGGPEGTRDLDTDLIVDHAELQEAGAELDDPESMAMLDGGMDDPDGTGAPAAQRADDEAGWDVDPVAADTGGGRQSEAGADGDAIPDDMLVDVPDVTGDPELEEIDTEDGAMEQFPDDAPGADSARW